MTNKNKHGLSRNVPSEVKRQIRQNSKFGCVICRSAILTYEHIDPLFKDATEHDASKMCILCPNHQRDSTDGILSKKKIIAAYEKIKASSFIDDPKRDNFFNLSRNSATVKFGKATFKGYKSVINVVGENFLSIKDDPENSDQILLSGKFLDDKGNELFRIENNEWIGNHKNWDVDFVGRKLTIRRSKGEILIQLSIDPEANTLTVHKLNMWAKPFHLKIQNDLLFVGEYDYSNNSHIYFGVDADFSYGNCGIFLHKNNNRMLTAGAIKFTGGWTRITGTGIEFARGNSTAHVRKLSVTVSHNVRQQLQLKIEKPYQTPLQFFVQGTLDVVEVSYPDWNEQVYSLDGIELSGRPISWGNIGKKADGKSIELFHFPGSDYHKFYMSETIVGLWADNLIKMPWADEVFEREVKIWDTELEGYLTLRIKRSEMKSEHIPHRENNPETGKWFHPHEFAGISVWK